MDIELLRQKLHEAVDQVFDTIDSASSEAPSPGSGVVTTKPGLATGAWTYRWPGGDEETFDRTRWFEVEGDRGPQAVRIAWTRRSAWGRSDRERAVVFGQVGKSSSSTYYPWTEFVETDDDRFAAPIPDPTHPRATLKDGQPLPGLLAGHQVQRTDSLFDSISDGPSLRLVVSADHEAEMARHGYWVASLRGRI